MRRPSADGLDLTLDQEHAAQIKWLAGEYGWTIGAGPADPAWRITRMFAARMTAHRAEVLDAMAQTTLAFATKTNLDHIGLTYFGGTARLAGEEDDDYRDRLAHVVDLFAVGLSGGWYEAVARRVAGVADARMTSPAAGQVTVHVLADEALLDDATPPAALYPRGIPDAPLLAAVTAAVTAPDAAQQTDVVTVSAATRQRYDVAVALTVVPGASAPTVLAEARTRLAAVAAARARLAEGVSKAILAGAAAASIDAVREAVVVLSTVSEADPPVVAPVDAIAAADGVAPEPRNLVVTVA